MMNQILQIPHKVMVAIDQIDPATIKPWIAVITTWLLPLIVDYTLHEVEGISRAIGAVISMIGAIFFMAYAGLRFVLLLHKSLKGKTHEKDKSTND